MINLRGKIIPVCDLAGRLGLPPHDCESPKTVVAETAIAKIDDRMVVLLNLTGLFGLAALEAEAA